MKYTLRGYRAEDQAQDVSTDPSAPIRFIASTEGVKRDGMDLSMSQWDLRNFKRNPVFLWAHDYMGRTLPIGKVKITPDTERKALMADVTFDPADAFAMQVRQKYADGYLNAVSVGWNTVLANGANWDTAKPEDIRLDLLDLSGVPVPGDPDALMERAKRSVEEALERTEPTTRTINPHKAPCLVSDEPFDLTAEVIGADHETLSRMSALVDTNSNRYYFLHHHRDGGVNWSQLSRSMVQLFTEFTPEMTDDEREAVYKHLARHYEGFRLTPPEYLDASHLKALGSREVAKLFLHGEADDLLPPEGIRAGAVLSKRNKDDLSQAQALIQKVLDSAVKEDKVSEDQTPERSTGSDEVVTGLLATLRGFGNG